MIPRRMAWAICTGSCPSTGTPPFLASEHLSDTQTAVFRAIAPFVADGSHIMFVGEDAAQFAWVFRKNPATGIIEAHEEEVIPVLASEYRRLRGGPGDALS